MQSFRGGFGGGRGSGSSGYNFYGEHRENEGSGSRDFFIRGRGRGGRGGFRSRGRPGFGYGSPDKSGGRSSVVTKSYSEEVQDEVEQLYKKKFKFNDEFNEWKIPDSSALFRTGPTLEPAFQIPKLLELKRNLNATKSKLDNKDMVSWTRHTAFTNRAEVVIRMLRRDFNPELCTHAWAKMQEMLWTFKVVPESMKLNSVHLCEAPGAFITCLNHYLKTHRPDCEWKWKAITLNPYYEGNDHLAMIDQDKFMSETWSHWFVGADNTGDITTWDNLLAFRESVKKDLEEVHLITADGSINCVDNPGEQEALVAQLLFCETVTALALLKQKGSFILKTFTTLEHHTVCLLYIINCCFSEVHVFKPATSKAGNSEQYIICLGYKGRSNVLTHGHLERFRAVYGERTPPFPFLPLSAIPESFLTQLINCATKFARYQMDVIEENVRLYDCMTHSEKQFIIEVKELTCDKFKSRCKLKKLPREKAIVEHLHLDHNHLWVVQSVQGDPLHELFSRRSVDSILSQLEARRGKIASATAAAAGDFSPPLQDFPGVGEGGPLTKKPRLALEDGAVKAVQHLLNEVGYIHVGTKVGDKSEDLAAVAMEMTPDEVQWLKGASSKSLDMHDQIKQLDGCRALKVCNSRFCRHDVLKSLTEALAKSQIMQAAHVDEHEQLASHVTPGHALSVGQPPFFLSRDAVNFAALDYLVGLTGKGDEDSMLMFMDLAGAPSDFSHYLYWRRQHMVKGWGMVRVDNPKLGPGRIMEQLAPWETFQVLGPHSGVDICDNNSIKSLCAGLGNYCPSGVNLVIGDMPPVPFGAHPPGHAEYHSKRQLLSQLTCACKILSKGGTFVCRVYELLTRFSAGIVYLLYKLFDEVTILKPITSSPTSPERFLIAKGFHGCQPNIPEALLEVNGHIADLRREAGKVASEEQGDVLEILPVQLLFEEQFHRFLTLSNERIARHRVRMVALLDRYFTNPELQPDGDESQELIRRGILELLDLPMNPF